MYAQVFLRGMHVSGPVACFEAMRVDVWAFRVLE